MRYIVFVLCALGLVGCSASTAVSAPVSDTSTQVMMPQQLIVRFDDRRDEAAARASLDELSVYGGHTLVYVRPMSGDAHVLRTAQKLDQATFDALLLKLSTAPGVSYAERDRIMRPS